MIFGNIRMRFQNNFASLTLQNYSGVLAQLARALAWHARGHRFDSDMLHKVLNNLKKPYSTHI